MKQQVGFGRSVPERILEALEPAKLVVEFWPGRRVAVRKIEASDDYAIHCSLDVTNLIAVRVPGQDTAHLDRLTIARQDRHPIPGFLPTPHRTIARFLDRSSRKLFIRRLKFLQADDIGGGLLQPSQEDVEPPIDAIDLVGSELQRRSVLGAVITAIAFTGLGFVLGLVTLVGGKGFADIDTFLELAILVTADITFIGSGIDQFALAHGFLLLSIAIRKRTGRPKDAWNHWPSADSHNGHQNYA